MCYNAAMEIPDIPTSLHILHERLAPTARAGELVDSLEGYLPNARRAAVLLPLFEQDGELAIAFIRRATTLRVQAVASIQRRPRR